jgi:D-alanine-D-alanine ligase
MSIISLNLGKVAVLMGGASAEREVSLMSGTGVLAALRSQGVDAHAFDPSVQGALELLGIPYTGSGVMASSIAVNKVMTKRIWRAEGLPTPGWCEVDSVEAARSAFATLGAPMIVKPAREGSSLGLTKVMALDEVDAAYALAAQLDPKVLCEQFVRGDEVTVPLLGSGDQTEVLPVIRIVAPEGNYDYQNKYFTDTTQYLVPCGLPEGEETAIQAIVRQAYLTLGCRSWARADVMIDAATRKPYLLEINTAPGMTGHSLVPMSARAAGISYEALCVRLLQTASLDYGTPTV